GVTAALTEVVRRGTGQQAKIGRPSAGKTGTSQGHGDAWFVGYTPELVAAVWMGYPEGLIPMEPPATTFAVTGGSYPALVWSRFAGAALTGVAYGQLAEADTTGLVSVEVDLTTGFLAGPLCPRANVHRIQVPGDAVPTVICPIHNPTGLIELGSGEVPDVIGFSLGAAVELLEGFGYTVSVHWDEPGPLQPGTVYGQEPSASFPAPAGSVVRLTVAGPEPGTVVPGVLGIPVAEAVIRLQDLGIEVEVRTEAEADPEDALRRSGLVWSQMPAVGTPLPPSITIWANP
ncbi:MAG: PASTA domain-containing protein, partial [Acidimicrobiia bacterium]|nr:PASTA domain-containing protein [Acidimicrobiia bacterium]